MPTSLSVCMYLAEYRKIHWHLYRATTFTSAPAIYYFYKGKMLSCKKNFFFSKRPRPCQVIDSPVPDVRRYSSISRRVLVFLLLCYIIIRILMDSKLWQFLTRKWCEMKRKWFHQDRDIHRGIAVEWASNDFFSFSIGFSAAHLTPATWREVGQQSRKKE